MNQIDFTKQGGFPFDQDVLGFLQDSILAAASSASLGGQLYVLSGCEIAGENIGNGIVVINGEILPFAGGAKQEKVVVVEQFTNMIYEDGTPQPSIKTRYATFGDDGVTNLLWADFKRNTSEGVLARLERLERISAPFLPVKDGNGADHRGGMVLWKKPANLIPQGWREVEDWRGRVPMGYNPGDADFDTVGEVGGSKDYTLLKGNLPALPLTVNAGSGHTLKVGKAERGSADVSFYGPNQDGAGSGSFTTANMGVGSSFSLLNPYRVVMFIEYTGN